ncbi:hypothetical protein ACFL6Y_08285, partial [Elusimicrobiota bacterium]
MQVLCGKIGKAMWLSLFLLLVAPLLQAEYLLVSSTPVTWDWGNFVSDGSQYIYFVRTPSGNNKYIGKYDKDLNELFTLASNAFVYAKDIAIDNYNQTLYMADQIYNPSGGYDFRIRAFSLTNGSQTNHWLVHNGGSTTHPKIAVGINGDIFFVYRDYEDGSVGWRLRIKVFSPSGSLVRTFTLDDLWITGDICISGGYIYLLAGGTGGVSISKYNPVGSLISRFNVSAADGMFVDSQGFAYVKDDYGTIYKYSETGSLVLTINKPDWAVNYSPSGIASFDNDRIFAVMKGDSYRFVQWLWNTPPSNPVIIKPTGNIYNHYDYYDFTWNPSSDAEYDDIAYEVWIGASVGSLAKAGDADYASLTVQGLNFGQSYYWKVLAKDPYASSESTVAQFTFNLDNTAPTAPGYSNLSFTTRDTTVYLDWNPSNDPDGDPITYRVYIGNTPGSLSEVHSGYQISYQFSGFNWGQTYYWKVSAEDQFGAKTDGAIKTIKVNFRNSAPTAPNYSNLNYTTRNSSVILSWEASDDEDWDTLTYKLYLGNSPTALSLMSQTEQASYSFSGFTWGSTYYWKVRVEDPYGGVNEGPTVSVTVNFQNENPTAPILNGPFTRGVHSTETFSDTFSWLYSSDADGDSITYKVLKGPNPSSLSLVAQDIVSNTHILDDLAQWSTNYIVITASDTYGGTTQSAVTAIRYYLDNQPPYPIVYSGTWGQIVTRSPSVYLSWQLSQDPEEDPINHSLWLGTSPDSLALAVQGEISAYKWDGLSFGTTYYWKVMAEDSFGAVTEGEVKNFSLTFKNSPPPVPA